METISRSLLTFLLNSLWQIPLAAGIAWLACRAMNKGPASHKHAVWVAALLAAVLLPLASIRTTPQTASPHYSPSLADAGQPAQPASYTPARTAPPPQASRSISFGGTTANVLLGAWLMLMAAGLARLAWASFLTVRVRGTAQRAPLPDVLHRVWTRCCEAFGVGNVPLLVSARVAGPLTAGGAIILPESLLTELSEDVLTTAVGHEMAHVARGDFACNILYQFLQLPIAYHPATWLIRREIGRTREMSADEMVTQRVLDAGAYARSIMSIANGMMAQPSPGHTLGVFDGDILETRIRRLLERPAANLKRARLLLATGLGALALCAVVASTLALTARAQGAAAGVMKEAAAAYNRGDYPEATAKFENAVTLEPSNVKARLLLAHTLLRQFTPLSGAGEALANRARQQYLDVLALDAKNRGALEGLMTLDTNTKRFEEAHAWAMKAIQADAGDKDAYYTAAFIDWARAYPDYAQARLAAGMKPWDPGMIPDAALRQGVRSRQGARIEEGFRLLQVALQLDPNYSDAMAYMNLLYRIQAGLADTPAQSANYVAKADSWVTKALDARRIAARTPRPPEAPLDPDAPVPAPWAPPPPPPPPPPPLSGAGEPQGGRADAPNAIYVGDQIQAAKLLHQARPLYPAAARQAGIQGVVDLRVIIGKDGKVRSVTAMRWPDAELAAAATDAVKQWVYHPTLLNGEPVEVISTVQVNFTLSR